MRAVGHGVHCLCAGGSCPGRRASGLGWGRRLGPRLSGAREGHPHEGSSGAARSLPRQRPGCWWQLACQVSTRTPVGPRVGGRGGLSREGGGPASGERPALTLPAPSSPTGQCSAWPRAAGGRSVASRPPSAGREPCQPHTCFPRARVFALAFALVKERRSPRFLSRVTSLHRLEWRLKALGGA